MSLPLLLLRKGLRLPSPAARAARGIASKPARDPIGAKESVLALSTLFVAFMAPCGWILSHLENYKHGE